MWNHIVRAVVLVSLVGLRVALAADPGPAVGETFPDTLDRADQSGQHRNLDSLMGEKGLAVFFVRSADWCPFCKGQLVDVNRHLQAFETLGLNVVSVSVDEVPLIAAFAEQQHIGYTMLADPKGDINLKLGIRDEQYPVGSAQYGVPRPVLYVLDRSRTIRLRYMEPTYRTRPDLDGVLRDIAELKLENARGAAAADTNARRESAAKLVCREEITVGSHVRRRRCMTNAQREAAMRDAQEAIRRGREGGGTLTQ